MTSVGRNSIGEKETQTLNQREMLTANIATVHERIAEAAERAGRQPQEITLIAVSKTKPLSLIETAYELGLRHFGENRVQELQEKIAAFGPEELHWHLIGHLQSNKAGKVAGHVAYIHSVDSLHLAETLQRALEKSVAVGSNQRQRVLLQVNISGEASKEGMRLEEVATIARQIATLSHLEIQGLMTVAPLVDDPEDVRPVFRKLRELREQLRVSVPECHWQHLSMGMTDDYPVAIEEGATIVRIGRAIFGERATRK
jgi:pyridoxal phosphate enzyme (YggS family)